MGRVGDSVSNVAVAAMRAHVAAEAERASAFVQPFVVLLGLGKAGLSLH